MALEKAGKLLKHCLASAPTYSFEILKATSLQTTETLGSTTRLVYKLIVPETICNVYQSVHGGAISTIIDEFTTHAIYVGDSKGRASVSLELSVSFIAAARAGDTMIVIADCNKVGSQLGFASAEVYSADRLVAQGKHTKYLMRKPLLPEDA
mmetsp:Transcript_33516/g.58714  ORF Transcript_33516/g.58714 Transcript_33516/m.58714 type:complete len:152 (+) Transcript_33516:2532-2987(+)